MASTARRDINATEASFFLTKPSCKKLEVTPEGIEVFYIGKTETGLRMLLEDHGEHHYVLIIEEG